MTCKPYGLNGPGNELPVELSNGPEWGEGKPECSMVQQQQKQFRPMFGEWRRGVAMTRGVQQQRKKNSMKQYALEQPLPKMEIGDCPFHHTSQIAGYRR